MFKQYFFELMSKWKWYLSALLILISLVAIYIIISSYFFPRNANHNKINTTSQPTISPIPLSSFGIDSTNPLSGQNNVNAGEIIISFISDRELPSSKAFTMTISPKLPYYWKFINSYPTKIVEAQVFGGLSPNTTYTVSVFDYKNKPVNSWSFTTVTQPAQSSSALIQDNEQKIISNYFPLFQWIPYSNNDFAIDYTSPSDNTLLVNIKNSNVSRVKQEVNDWIKSHGEDPSKQKINFVNSY